MNRYRLMMVASTVERTIDNFRTGCVIGYAGGTLIRESLPYAVQGFNMVWQLFS